MSLTKKVGLMTLGQGINVIVNILFLPYMARTLSYVQYGTYGQTLLVITVVATFLTLGLPQLLNVYLADDKKDNRLSLSSNFFTSLILGMLGSILTFSLANWVGVIFNNNELPYLVKIYSLSVLFSLPFASFNSFFIYTGRIKLSVSISVLTNIIKILLVVFSIQFLNSLTIALVSLVFISFLQFAISFFYIKSELVYNIKFSLIRQQVLEGFPLGMTAVIGIVVLYTDSTMISTMLNIKEYAIYRNGAIEVPFISTIYASIAAIVLPEVAKLWQRGKVDELFILKKKVIMNTIYLLYPILIFLIFNSQNIIILYLGSKYIESGLIFAIFNLTLLIRVNSYADILISAKRTRYIMFTYVVVVIVNVIINYVLINLFGSVGAAMSTVFSLLLLAGMQLKKTLKISNKRLTDIVDLRKVITVILISLFVGGIMFLITNGLSSQILKLIISFCGYSILVFLPFKYLKYYSKDLYMKLFPSRIVNIFIKK